MSLRFGIPIILFILAILAVGTIAYYKSQVIHQPQPTNPSSTTKRLLISKVLQLSLTIPTNSQIIEKTTFIDIILDKGKINVSRIATNFPDLSGYIKDFDSKRILEVSEEKQLSISGYPSISRIETFAKGPVSKQYVYFIYVNGWIYSLSTTSESLYNDLDQIAKSFRYTP